MQQSHYDGKSMLAINEDLPGLSIEEILYKWVSNGRYFTWQKIKEIRKEPAQGHGV